MQKTDYIWYSGKLVEWDQATTHVLTHTLHYGGGAFEGIRFYNTDKGPAIFKLAEHVERLYYSGDALAMDIPFTQEEICQAIIDTVRANKLKEGYIRPLVFFGYGAMGVNPVNAPVELIIACWPWGAYLPVEMVDIKTTKYIRVHPKSTIADAKLCGHYLNGILSLIEIRGTHYHEALFLDADGYIAEGAGENFFIVKDGVIYTPSLGKILAGITRNTIIELARSHQYEVIEKPITLEEAYQADEAFFTGTAVEVTPIKSIDDNEINAGKLGPVSALLKNTYHRIVRGQEPEYLDALTIIE